MINTGSYNTGYCNTGYCNTGNWNTGNWNTGHYNTGYWNTGHYNTGDCNTGSHHVGCFNTIPAQKAYYFNKLLDKDEWDKAEKPNWVFRASPTTWISSEKMTGKEKLDHPEHKKIGGYLRVNAMKEQWAEAFANATPEDIELTKNLPGFDAEVFLEITGIDLRDKPSVAPCEGREVEIDGVTYVLKAKGEQQ